MAFAIYSAKANRSHVGVLHVFFGETEDAAWKALEAHADICPKFGPAYRGEETIETVVTIDEIPAFDERSIEAFASGEDEEPEEEEESEHTPW